jgi:hypothetical protein
LVFQKCHFFFKKSDTFGVFKVPTHLLARVLNKTNPGGVGMANIAFCALRAKGREGVYLGAVC